MTAVRRQYRGVPAVERREQRRRALLEACLELIGGGGTSAVTAESVSGQAKLTKRYFYESFASRDAILLAALDELYVELTADIGDVVDNVPLDDRARAITEVFVTTLCDDPRRARLYAEAPALPALQARREEAIVGFTDLVGPHVGPTGRGTGRLMTRIIVAGVTEAVTSWINGTLKADRSTLVAAIVALGGTVAGTDVVRTSGDR